MTLLRRLLLVGLVVGAIAVSLVTGGNGQADGLPPTRHATKVVVLGIPRLAVHDLTSGEMPNLARLAQHGATGAMRAKTLSTLPSISQAYASLGAGELVNAGVADAYDSGDQYKGSTAMEAQRLATGKMLTGSVVMPAVPLLSQSNVDGTGIGSLGTVLRAAGHPTAVVANADTWQLNGKVSKNAPAALAIVDTDGVAAFGTVGEQLVRHNQSAPYGYAVNRTTFAAAVTRALDQADVVVADPGETLRAVSYLPNQTPAQASRSRAAAVTRTDEVVGDVARHLPKDALLLVVGMTPGTTQWALTPVVAHGAGVRVGHLVSPSTHHAGLVLLTDIAPTVLTALGAPDASGMSGSAMRYQPGSTSWNATARLDGLLVARASINSTMSVMFIVLEAVLYVLAMAILLWIGSSSAADRWIETAVLACAAWPFATFVVRISSALSSHGFASLLVSWLIAIAVGITSQRLRRHPLDPLLAVCGLTVAIITLDLATGAHLMTGSFFGYTPTTSNRFTGINNATFAILAGCAIVCCAAIVDRAHDKVSAWWIAAALAVVVVVADGAPWMGADVGGLLTLVPVLGLMLWTLAGHRIRRNVVVGVLIATVVALAAAVGVDALRAPDQRTHIGRFFLGAGSGNGQLLTSTISRKWSANMHVFGKTAWAWMIPIIAGFSVYVLVVARGWRRLLPTGSPRRIAVIAALAMGIIGWLINDSGVVVTALVFVYLGPMLLLLQIREGGEGLHLIELDELPLEKVS